MFASTATSSVSGIGGTITAGVYFAAGGGTVAGAGGSIVVSIGEANAGGTSAAQASGASILAAVFTAIGLSNVTGHGEIVVWDAQFRAVLNVIWDLNAAAIEHILDGEYDAPAALEAAIQEAVFDDTVSEHVLDSEQAPAELEAVIPEAVFAGTVGL